MLPKSTIAAILVEQKKPLVIDEINLPSELAVGQVLIKIHFSGICGSQIGEINGSKGPDKYLPHLLGHEGSGEVLQVGPGVNTVKIGDMVVLHWKKGAGIEASPPTYEWKGEKLNAGSVTTFNKLVIASENRITAVSESVDYKKLALFGCAVTTGHGVVENNANIQMGQSVIVYGAGGVGLNIIQAAFMRSAFPIIAVDKFENRLDLARELGATHTINSTCETHKEQFNKLLKGEGCDVFIDNTGHPLVISLGYQLTKPKGKVILVGVPKVKDNVSIHTLPLHFGKEITGSHGGEISPEIDIPRYLKLLNNGLLDLNCMITEEYKLEEINKAIQRMTNGKTKGRCIINMQDQFS